MIVPRLRPLLLAPLLAACASTGGGPSAGAPEAALPAVLPLKHAPRPTSPAISPADLMTRLYIFADDSMQGREVGTIGNVKGTDYVAAEMRRMGLQPGGENGTYFQTVPVYVARVDGARTIAVDGQPLALGTDVLPYAGAGPMRALLDGAAARPLDGVQAVYGGQLGGALLEPARAAGKLMVVTVPAGTNPQRILRSAMLDSLDVYGDAAGVAVVALDQLPGGTASRLMGSEQMHVRAGDAPAAAQVPTVMLVSPAAAQRLLGVPSLEGLQPGAAGKVVSGSVALVDAPAPYPARNVIGILPGSDPARRGQYVAVGAHNDHIGLTDHPIDHDSVVAFNTVVRRQGVQDRVRAPTAAEQARITAIRDSLRALHGGVVLDSVNNGADDDGSGTVALLEIAERFATAPDRPRRSLLFVSHTGEEKGLWGSEWFTDHPTVPRDSIVAQLNMDMVGRGKPTDAMGRGPNNVQMIGLRRLSTQLGDLIDSVNANRTPRMDPDLSFDAAGHPLNRYCRSDHYMYARYGIPITYFSLGYHTGYHQIIDEPQEIDYGHMARIAGFVHDIAEAIANRPARLVVDQPKPDPNGRCRQ
jgi:hypothetical protein